MTYIVDITDEVHVVEMAGCGHTIYLSATHMRNLRKSHKSFYCTYCGNTNHYPGKSKSEKLQAQLNATRDQLETVRQQRDQTEYRRRAEKAAKTRLKNRIGKGVCPCCNRTFQNLAAHMANKHPDFTAGDGQ